MKEEKDSAHFEKGKTIPMSPNQRLNGNLTAQPKDIPQVDEGAADTEMGAAVAENSEMKAQDAKESGYTDDKGQAISKAKPDVKGRPTGAFTDVGAGRSSAVRPHDSSEKH